MTYEETDGQLSLLDLDTWSGKTCQEHSVQTKARTSESFSKKSQKSQTVKFLFLDLTKESGQTQDASWQMGGRLLGGYSMHSIGESPKDVVESHLSQILEDIQPQKSSSYGRKYLLSARACQGILNRATRRGKKLPTMLQMALEQVIAIAEYNEKEAQALTETETELPTQCKTEKDVQGGAKDS